METSEDSVKFTDAENKMRKKWLFWSIQLPAFFIGSIALISSIFVFSDFIFMFLVLSLSFLFSLGLYVNYYCAYKNPGTALLLSGMILTVINLIEHLFHPENSFVAKKTSALSVIILAMLCYELILFYYSYKLRKINKKMQERSIAIKPEYINAMSIFSTANNVEELDGQFTKLKSIDDSGKTVQALCQAYGQQKEVLKLAKR